MKNRIALFALVFLFFPGVIYSQGIVKIWNRAVEETRSAEEKYLLSQKILATIGWSEISWENPEEALILLTEFVALREGARKGQALADEAAAGFRKASVSWDSLCRITRDNDPDNWAQAVYNSSVTSDNLVKSSEMYLEYDRLLTLIKEIIEELSLYLAETENREDPAQVDITVPDPGQSVEADPVCE